MVPQHTDYLASVINNMFNQKWCMTEIIIISLAKVTFIIHAKYIFEIMFGTAAYEYILHQLQHQK